MLLNDPEIRKLESRFISLFERTFKKGVKGKRASALAKSVRTQFQSSTFRIQMNGIIDDIYLQAIGYADGQLQEIGHSASQNQLLPAHRLTAASSGSLPITEEAVRQASGLADEVTESIVRILKDEGLYLEHPTKLEKRIRDLWGGEKYRAVRFARTFTADVAVNTSLFRYQQQGIDDLQFYAKIDDKTSPQCRALHGTVFKTNSSEARQYRPPLHFHCRSDLLPVPITRTVDPQTRIENRDFSRQMDQDFNFLDDRTDSKVVDKALQDIDTFREKYSIDQFILDEDLEARLQKLGIQIESPEMPSLPTKEGIEATVRKYEDEIKQRSTEKCYAFKSDGTIVLEKTGTHNQIDITPAEGKLLKGTTFTHNHPRRSAFSPEDIRTACNLQMKEIRATGTYRTYIMRMKDGSEFVPELWDRIYPKYVENDFRVRIEFELKIAHGEMTPGEANLLHHHEIWSRTAKEIKELDYSYIEE